MVADVTNLLTWCSLLRVNDACLIEGPGSCVDAGGATELVSRSDTSVDIEKVEVLYMAELVFRRLKIVGYVEMDN